MLRKFGLLTPGIYGAGARLTIAGPDGIEMALGRIAQWAARIEFNRVPTDLTNNAGGTASTSLVIADMAASVAAYTATTSDAAQKASFDTMLGVHMNVSAALAEHLNRINGRLGIPLIDHYSLSSQSFTVNTIPAVTQSVTGASLSGSCVDRITGNARLEAMRANTCKLIAAVNRVAMAVGAATMNGNGGLDPAYADADEMNFVLADLPATGDAVDGSALSTLAKATVDAQLVLHANAFTTMAAYLIELTGALPSDLTDSSGGSASLTTLVANALPALAVGAATTSAPKAGFDTALGVIENNLAEVAARANVLLKRAGLLGGVLTDNTGQTVNGTLESQSVNLTAVDGSTGTVAVSGADARDRMTTISNAISSIGAAINKLTPMYGERPLTDSLGGTVTTVIANIAATGTGVGHPSDPVTLLDTAVDTWLSNTRDNLSTLAAKLNLMTNSTNDIPPIGIAYVPR